MFRTRPGQCASSVLILLLSLLATTALSMGGSGSSTTGTIRFLESFPQNTQLDQPGMDQAWQVWPQVLATAQSRVDVASFYFSRQGDGEDATAPAGVTDYLVPVLAQLPEAGLRGCQVRVLGDAKFQKTYPEALAWLNDQKGVASRAVDMGSHWGGVMHAKYFVVDEKTLYVGSQNWDWRAMTQIRELGALIEHPGLAGQLASIFELDWKMAGSPAPAEKSSPPLNTPLPQAPVWEDLNPANLLTADNQPCQAVLAASPPQALPEGVAWDLPLIIETIDNAQAQVRLQLLSYGLTDREKRFWPELDNALRRAAARKVQVQIILSNWAKSWYSVPWIQSLAVVPNLEIKFSNIPAHEAGLIPYARVEHPKYLTADGKAAWLGTSNWSRDYFFQSRNVSLFLRGESAVQQLDSFFEAGWNGPYTETVDPCGQYQPPKRN